MDMWVAFLLAIVNNVAVNKGYTYLLESALNSLGYMSKSGNAGLCFFPKGNFLRNCCAFFFHSSYNIYIPINSAERFQFFHSVSNTCYFLFLFIIAMLMGVK